MIVYQALTVLNYVHKVFQGYILKATIALIFCFDVENKKD
jgi:hypothetical protein